MADIESTIVLLLERTNDLIIQEANFLGGVHDKLQLMKFEFEKFRCSLKDADAQQDEDETLEYWMKAVREVVYRAEEAIDMFTSKTSTLSRGRQFTRTIRRIALEFSKSIALYELHSNLNSINEKICTISSRWLVDGPGHEGAHQQAEQHASSETYDRLDSITCGLSSLLAPEPDFVGFEEELETLLEQLTQGEQRLCVVSVFGMPGLGKTTLAKKVYNSNAVKSHFNTRSWVYASEQYSARDLLLQAIAECYSVRDLHKAIAEILSKSLSVLENEFLSAKYSELNEILCQKWGKNKSISSTSELLESLMVSELSYILMRILSNNRYLIIVDDLQEREAWDYLEFALRDTGNGSRVLVTTHNRDIAMLADSESRIHQLPFFRRHECWQLFCKKAFSRLDACWPSDLEEAGRRILRKCRGMPLAVVIIGGLLSRKEPQEWKNVEESIKWQWDEEDQFSDILSLTWKDLPYYLKPCFLYMCNFPDNYKFRTKQLVQLWEAEGMLQPRGDQTEEQVGEEFLMELIHRGMIQIATKTSTSGSSIQLCYHFTQPKYHSDSPYVCQLVLYNSSIDSFSSQPPPAFARTLLWLNWLPCGVELRLSTEAPVTGKISNLKQLRVLDLEGASISELPNEIGQLIHLRYLGLRRTLLKGLPRSVRNLRNLQTLDVKYTQINQIPEAIEGMRWLRHLLVSREIKVGNSELIEPLKDLRTISMMHADTWMEKGLSTLVNLRKFGIKGDFSFCSNSLYGLRKLESLRVGLNFGNATLNWKSLPNTLAKLHLESQIEKLPPANEFPQNLVKLCLRWSLLKEDQFAILQSFQNLKVLLLGRGSFIGKKMVFSPGGFSSLEVLRLDQLNDLEEWSIEKRALPCLVSLFIQCCRRLKELPEGLHHVLSTLKFLETESMADEFKSAVNTRPIIKLMPSINISIN
ncbi:hypothetical protein ACLOJK_019751 [Asimina triloba]